MAGAFLLRRRSRSRRALDIRLACSVRTKQECFVHDGIELVSLDAINEERRLFCEDGLSVEEWEATNLIARERVKMLMERRIDVVVDDTNCYRWLRDRWRDLATANGHASLVLYLPPEASRLRSPIASSENRRRIAAPMFEEIVRTFEPPEREPVVELATPEEINSFIRSRRNA